MNDARCWVEVNENVVLQPRMSQEMVEALAELAIRVMDSVGCAVTTELAIQIVTDDFMQHLNRTYREIDAPTDVLSFVAEALPEEIAMEEPPYLGDLIIAYNYTLKVANEANHTPSDEFGLAIVHGILHLVGYDHDTPDTQKAMWEKQAELLLSLGINMVVPDFVHDSEG